MDIKLQDNKNGGDAIFTGGDFKIISGWQNMPYLAIVGGNLAMNTIDFKETEQRFDWWGNSLFHPNNPNLQFNSDFERKINELPINSKSRLILEETIKNDLKFLKEFSTFTVDISIVGVDKYSIFIKIEEPTNLESNEFIYLWDATLNELQIK